MTLWALLVYAVTSSKAYSDSDRIAAVIYQAHRDKPSFAVVVAK